jgi:hypothetical protein
MLLARKFSLKKNPMILEITEGTYATFVFNFTNVGDKPLLLKDVRPSCGCTASNGRGNRLCQVKKE